MKKHELKIWPEFFDPIMLGKKNFEVRKNDRGFKEGDHLILKEWLPSEQKYTGRELTTVVTYMTDWEQKPGFVVMGIS